MMRGAVASCGLLLAVVALGPGCARREQAGEPASLRVVLADATRDAGIEFRHFSGARGEFLYPETFGPGAGWLDHDGDGWLDLLIVNGNAVEGLPDPRARHALFRNLGGGRFEDVTERAGLAGSLYGMGFASADADNDGDQDVLIYGVGKSLFFVNDGRGRFHEATAASGLASLPGWVGAAAFLDYDRDGKLDLFAGNYVAWNAERDRAADCTFGTGKRKYCPVAVFPPSVPQLFRGRGDGTFEETTIASGLALFEGKALGVIVEDYDRDGDPDIFVACDTTPNLLLRNRGDGTFEDQGIESGFATGADGAALAGMGIDSAWIRRRQDGETRLMVAIGNFAGEPTTLHVQEGERWFIERSVEAGIGRRSLDRVTFGLGLLDIDLDGHADLFGVNGHVFDVEELTRVPYRQRAQAFLGLGDARFEEARPTDPSHFLNRPILGRALAAADYDRDGDLDLLVTENQGGAILLRNDLPGPRRYVRIDLRGTRSNRDAIGAEVTLRIRGSPDAAGSRRTRKGSSSYLSQSERQLTFGLGRGDAGCDAEVLWPSGLRETFRDVPVCREVLLVEGTGESAPGMLAPGSRPLADAPPGVASIAARLRGITLMGERRFAEAVAAFDEALRLDPNDLAAHRSRLVALEHLGRKTDSAARAREAAATFSDANLLLSHFAVVLREMGHRGLARFFYEEAARLDPLRTDVWIALGNDAFDRQAHDEALRFYGRALERNPASVEALANSGKVHALRKDYPEALPLLERAVAIQPDSATALSTLGGVMIEQGKLDLAEELLTRALRSARARETLITVHGNLGILHRKRRDRARAIEAFEAVLKLSPEDDRARAALESLRR